MTTNEATGPSAWRSAVDAALILAIGMGFGRFAFTAVYPHMVADGVLSVADGSLAASANYAGYLVGAILAMRATARTAHRLCLMAMTGTAVCLDLLGVVTTALPVLWIRGMAGVFSALALVAASLWLLEHRQQHHGTPVLFAGVGLGIMVSSELLVLGGHWGLHSHGLWLLLAAASLLTGLCAAPGLVTSGAGIVNAGNAQLARQPPEREWALTLIYGLAGFGYIITATYLPLMVKTALPNVEAGHVWAIFGLGAAPSCFVWHRLNARLGLKLALMLNLLLQALGVIVPVLAPSAASYIASALLVGGTFMGTVTIIMPAAQHLARHTGRNIVAMLTTVYSVGQIIGPLLAKQLYQHTHGFAGSLIAATMALAVGAVMSVTVQESHRR